MRQRFGANSFLTFALSLVLLGHSDSVWSRDVSPPAQPTETTTNNQPEKKKKSPAVIKSEAGLNIPEWGVAIDSFYDERLDNLIAGYKILNIVVTNRGNGDIYLDVNQDHWKIIDSFGKKYTATNHIKQIDSKLWDKLPSDFKKKIDYPQIVRPGKSTTVDVFFPKSVTLTNFKEIIWKSKHFDKEFNIFSNYEKNLEISADDKSFSNPTQQSIKWDKKGDLKTREEVLNPAEATESSTTTETATDESITDDKHRFDPSFDDAIILSPTPTPMPAPGEDEDPMPPYEN